MKKDIRSRLDGFQQLTLTLVVIIMMSHLLSCTVDRMTITIDLEQMKEATIHTSDQETAASPIFEEAMSADVPLAFSTEGLSAEMLEIMNQHLREVEDSLSADFVAPLLPPRSVAQGEVKVEALQAAIEELGSAFVEETPYTIQDYAKEVNKTIGMFNPFNVFEKGIEIPITITPQTAASDDVCDRPALLGQGPGQQCNPYAFIGKLEGTKSDVHWVFIARRYNKTYRDDPIFKDVAVIGYDPSTGATAFFQHLSWENADARKVPSPIDEGAEKFWLSPRETAGIDCYHCHASDPFIRSPYVDQVWGRAELPSAPFEKYNFIGSRYFSDWNVSHFRPNRTENECTKCHRIGIPGTKDNPIHSHYGLPKNIVAFASGRLAASQISPRYQPIPNGANYPQSHWMPPYSLGSVEKWDGKFAQSVDRLLQCFQTPKDKECRLTTTE